nr:hypothetical protein [Tanacetum cinerariifolium]
MAGGPGAFAAALERGLCDHLHRLDPRAVAWQRHFAHRYLVCQRFAGDCALALSAGGGAVYPDNTVEKLVPDLCAMARAFAAAGSTLVVEGDAGEQLPAGHAADAQGQLAVAPAWQVSELTAVMPGTLIDLAAFRGEIIQISLVEGAMAIMLIALSMTGSERYRREKHIARLAARDPLTGLYNRREFEARGQRLLDKVTDTRPAALLLMDIDHFKLVNDLYGHSAGDQLLISLSELIRSTLPDGSLAARLGGDEFVILLDDTSSERVLAWSTALREAFQASALHRFATPEAVTLSIGASLFSEAPASLAVLIERSDSALYESKRGGRNRLRLVDQRADDRTHEPGLPVCGGGMGQGVCDGNRRNGVAARVRHVRASGTGSFRQSALVRSVLRTAGVQLVPRVLHNTVWSDNRQWLFHRTRSSVTIVSSSASLAYPVDPLWRSGFRLPGRGLMSGRSLGKAAPGHRRHAGLNGNMSNTSWTSRGLPNLYQSRTQLYMHPVFHRAMANSLYRLRRHHVVEDEPRLDSVRIARRGRYRIGQRTQRDCSGYRRGGRRRGIGGSDQSVEPSRARALPGLPPAATICAALSAAVPACGLCAGARAR